MFTGIISAIGHIVQAENLGDTATHGKRLTIQTPAGWLDDVAPGDSIALNGACMTVVHLDAPQHCFCVDVSAESLDKTTGLVAGGGTVNLEKATRVGDRLGGHIVSGHVDGVGEVSHFAATGESLELRVLVPAALARYMAFKGSVAINGVSLTVNRASDSAKGCEISINLIPHTAQHTTLGELKSGSRVNVEVDTVARYVERMLACGVHADGAPRREG